MAPKYKLSYFDFSGLGEPIRFLFYYGGVDFIDHRIAQKDWPALKSSAPLGQMPLLEVDGKLLHQSLAIARYVAKQVGLVGSNDLEDYEIDAAVDTVNDLKLCVAAFVHEKDAAKKQAIKENLIADRFPYFLSRLDAWAKANNGYLANKKLSWADLYFTSVTDYLGYFLKLDLLEGYPNLQAVAKNVKSVPRIKAWVERRPVDHFE